MKLLEFKKIIVSVFLFSFFIFPFSTSAWIYWENWEASGQSRPNTCDWYYGTTTPAVYTWVQDPHSLTATPSTVNNLTTLITLSASTTVFTRDGTNTGRIISEPGYDLVSRFNVRNCIFNQDLNQYDGIACGFKTEVIGYDETGSGLMIPVQTMTGMLGWYESDGQNLLNLFYPNGFTLGDIINRDHCNIRNGIWTITDFTVDHPNKIIYYDSTTIDYNNSIASSVVSFPTPTSFLASVEYWVSPVFNSWLPTAEMILGIILVGLILAFLVEFIILVVRGLFFRSNSSMISSDTFRKLPNFLRKPVAKLDSWTFRHSPEGRRFMNDSFDYSDERKSRKVYDNNEF